MYRTRSFRREVRNKQISRKKRISHHWGFDWYSVDGKYSKGKIHCGCGLCKWGRKYGLPNLRKVREIEKFNEALHDWNSSS